MISGPVQIGLLAVAKDPASPELGGVTAATERIVAAGHKVVALHTAADAEDELRDQLTHWIEDPAIDVVIVLGGADSNAASAALAPLVTAVLPGFTDLFRWLMFQESGASAMLSSAEAARCSTTFVFVLPGAVAAAMDKLILPQFDPKTTPRNLLGEMPRLRDAVSTAVPTEVPIEKTQGGSGMPKRLPAFPASDRARPKTGANVIARTKPADDPATRPIDLVRLEDQLAISQGRSEDVTRPHDLARLLPKLPPGADAGGDTADTLEPDGDFTDTDLLAAPEAPSRPGERKPAPMAIPTILPRSKRPDAVAKTALNPFVPTRAPAPGTTPPRTTPPASTPPRPPTEQLPTVKRTSSAPSVRARMSSAPPVPPRNAPTEQYPTVSRAPAAPAASRPRPPSGTAPAVPVRAKQPTGGSPVIQPRAATPPPTPTPTTDALLAERDAAATAARQKADRAVTEPVPPAPTQDAAAASAGPSDAAPSAPTPPPPPAVATDEAAPRPRARTAPPPPPLAADARPPRAPTAPPPPVAASAGADRVRDLFAEPRKRGRRTLVFQILACVAVVVVGFGAVVYLLGDRDKAADQVAAVPPPATPTPAPTPAPAPAVIVDAAVVAPADSEPAIELEPPPPAPTPVTPPKPTRPTPPVTRPATRPTTTATTSPGPTTSPSQLPASTATATPAPATATPAADDDCDETACVLAKYDRPCCAKYKPASSDFQARVGNLPEALDKPMVRAGIATIKARVVTCGEQTKVAGTVKIAVTVSPDGAVTEATVADAPDATLGECVAGAMRSAKFGKSVTGGTFTYPFVFTGT